ncbi:MAG: hypothetical protein A3H98_14600 [Bacteroidetes bacterium RIFCSPLOWO2_02_FULL_36_8]|nr:MAG: hypothetical protein A3H98_14600 [Bacteroidetes bacterium RIFCSPLOWO2_02_FULL_36_8]OFY72135.1 MAG: hypothetical protein A3G23_07175 [Bacteroidetes bacterium RIFCSPLOWO2_12_FULL_37_12]
MKKIPLLFLITLFSNATFSQPWDAGNPKIIAPLSGCALSATEKISVEFFNYADTIQSPPAGNIFITLKNNGILLFTESFQDTIYPNTFYKYTFTNTVNMSVQGTYNFDVILRIPRDTFPQNDSMRQSPVICSSLSAGGNLTPDTSVCTGLFTDTLALSGFNGSILFWESSDDNGLHWSIINSQNDSLKSNAVKTTFYRVIVKNGLCPNDTSDIDTVTVYPPAKAEAISDTTISYGYSVFLNGSGGIAYSWSPATGLDFTSVANPEAKPLSDITYILTITDANGCTDNEGVNIKVIKDYYFVFSSLFTPNSDGKNDTWNIENTEDYPDCKLTIFNRFGTLILSKTGYTNDWDGKFSGSVLPDGTYFYMMDCPGSSKVFKGSILILSGGE